MTLAQGLVKLTGAMRCKLQTMEFGNPRRIRMRAGPNQRPNAC